MRAKACLQSLRREEGLQPLQSMCREKGSWRLQSLRREEGLQPLQSLRREKEVKRP
ncbi:MAG: hypothetical protein HQ502_15595 [Alphaproteobacteria bacterium]|nr:hypothetical protein [Alphaproteobacteria bacterium]